MADPDESIHPVYRGPLAQEGFEVAPALSGLECVARLRECVPDVLVLDPELPWGGGEGVLAIMGEVPQLAAVPVMVLTSCRDFRLLEAVARFPVCDYQLKPLAPDQLAKRLRAILAHPELRFTLAEHNGHRECSMAPGTDGCARDMHAETVDGRAIVHGGPDSDHVKQFAPTVVMEASVASQSQSEKGELESEAAPIDGWQARRCALSEERNENCSDEFDLSKRELT
jgi:DNA-binding response OmpR family regulator